MKIILPILMLFVLSAHAEKEAGGGNAVVCFDDSKYPKAIREELSGYIPDDFIKNHVESIEALDLALAKKSRGWEPSPGEPELFSIREKETLSAYANRMRDRFAPHFPAIAKILREGQLLFPPFSIVKENFGVIPVNDAGIIGLYDKDKCVLATVLAQLLPTIHMDTRLFYHPKHSRQSQAALELHEYVWAKGRALGQETSRQSQILVATIMLKAFPMTVGEMQKWFESLGFQIGEPMAYRIVRSYAEKIVSEKTADPAAAIRDAELSMTYEFDRIPGLTKEVREDLHDTFRNWAKNPPEFCPDGPCIDLSAVQLNYHIPN